MAQNGAVSNLNSTSTPLAALGIFTGISDECVNYSAVVCSCKTDKAGVLQMQFSPDGTNWDNISLYNIPINEHKFHSFPVAARYFRAVFVNGNAAQTYLRLQTIFRG